MARLAEQVSDYYRYPPLEAPDVQVLVDGTWYDGVLEARRQEGGRWLGYVRWSPEAGANHLGWFDYDLIRLARDGGTRGHPAT